MHSIAVVKSAFRPPSSRKTNENQGVGGLPALARILPFTSTPSTVLCASSILDMVAIPGPVNMPCAGPLFL